MTIGSYRDFYAVHVSHVRSQISTPSCKRKGPRGGVVSPFPVKLFRMLEATREEGLEHIVSWQVHGRCFMIHKSDPFVARVLPRHFRQSKLPSFQRQLNLWGFQKVVNGPDRGGYYHELFLRGRPDLAPIMLRVKGCAMEGMIKIETTSHGVVEDPDFYSYPYCEENPTMVLTTTTSSSSQQDVVSQRQETAIVIEPSTPPDSPRSAHSSPPRRRRKNASSSSNVSSSLVVTPPYESKTVDFRDMMMMMDDESRSWTGDGEQQRRRRPIHFQHDIRELHRTLAHEEDTSESSSSDLMDDLVTTDEDDLLLLFEGRTFQTVEECNAQALDSILSLEEEALYAKSVLSEVKRMKMCLGMGLLPPCQL